MHHFEDNDILFANQHGFRKNHSCDSQLILTVEDLAMNLDHGDQMNMFILDFSKAFDKVPHQCPISKLQFYGIQGSTLTWIKSWLTSRSQSVIIDGMCSKSVDVTSGVPQGPVIGPLMFLLLINDMQDDLVCTLRLFANDALLYHKITHNDDTLALQSDLDKLGLWADRWQMLFNPSKCYKMSVFRSRSPVVKDYTLYNQTLVAVQQHPYLGVLLSSDLRWNSHVDKIAKKGNSSLAFVKRNLYACSDETKRVAYVSLVRPHLEYATAVRDPYRQNQVEKLEAIQSRAVRFIKHDYSYNTSVSKLKKSLSLGLLSERTNSHRLQIFHKSVYNDIALPIQPYYQLSIRETRNYLTNSFIQPSLHHDNYKYSFFPRTIRDWNCLLP